MIRVVIKSPNLTSRDVNTKNGARTFYEQQAAIDRGGDFPLPFRIGVPDAKSAYAPGNYTLSPESLEVDRFGGLQIGRARLVPVGVAGK